MFDFDLAVLGGGPGGYVAAIRAAQLGQKVCIIEKDKLGGVCLNWGCIPTKALLKNAEVYQTVKKADIYGIDIKGISVDFKKNVDRSRSVAKQLSKGIEFLMKKNSITHFCMSNRIKKGLLKLNIRPSQAYVAEMANHDSLMLLFHNNCCVKHRR